MWSTNGSGAFPSSRSPRSQPPGSSRSPGSSPTGEATSAPSPGLGSWPRLSGISPISWGFGTALPPWPPSSATNWRSSERAVHLIASAPRPEAAWAPAAEHATPRSMGTEPSWPGDSWRGGPGSRFAFSRKRWRRPLERWSTSMQPWSGTVWNASRRSKKSWWPSRGGWRGFPSCTGSRGSKGTTASISSERGW